MFFAQLFLFRFMPRLLAVAVLASVLGGQSVAASLPTTVEGVFVDAQTGRGLAGARVELKQLHWRFSLEPIETPLATATTGVGGHFRFVGPWCGRFRLWCYSRDSRKMGTQVTRGTRNDIRIESQDLTKR